VGFAGWEMPVQYAGVLQEHRAVRQAAGLFDVSHMGEIRVRGEGARDWIDYLTPNNVASLKPGRAQYSALLTEAGTYVDDLLVYCVGDTDFLLVVNAANTAGDFDWMKNYARTGVEATDVSSETALLALQGPLAEAILAPLCDRDLGELRPFWFAETSVCGTDCIVSRTGYTGEDGFEIYLAGSESPPVWRALLERGAPSGLEPVGLGARDTLRLEAGLPLYGHEIDRGVTPLEAGLAWVAKLDRADFVGRDRLREQRAAGVPRRLVGLELGGRRIARQGAEVMLGGEVVGTVSSGTFSPTFERPIAMALLAAPAAEVGREVEVDVRGRREAAVVRDLPFYRRARNGGAAA
jgi:aminomethyltransferase